MDDRTRRPTTRRLVAMLTCLLLACALPACSDDGGGGGNGGNGGADTGGADAGDIGPDTGGADAGDTGTDADDDTGTLDTGGDAGDGGEVDTGPADTDDDGVLDTDDNCPQAANADQLDFDRDGVGDACDNNPAIWDPDNGPALEPVAEDEENISNDNATEGQAYDLSLPFVITGEVGPLEGGEGDWDYYSITVDEPTAVLVRLEPISDNFWPGFAAFGYQVRDANVQRLMIGAETGRADFREFFLPLAGRYTFAVTDSRNLLSNTTPVGGGIEYRFTASAIPLPEPKPVDLPAQPDDHSFDKRLHTYEVDTANVEGLRANIKGVSQGDNSFVLPQIAVWDPVGERTMAHTAYGEADDQTLQTDLRVKLGGYDSVVVIEDFVYHFGSNAVVTEIEQISVDSEFETLQQRQDGRNDNLVWLQPGQTVDGLIGPGVAVSGNQLAPDEDVYLMAMSGGGHITFTVTPTDSSQLQPEIDLGYYYAQQSQSYFSTLEYGPTASQPGEAVSVTAFIDGSSRGELAVRVRHAPNTNAQAPVGGPNYGYTIGVELSQPPSTDFGALPGAVAGVLDTVGQSPFFTFRAEAGDRIDLRLQEEEFFGQLIAYDANTYTRLGSSYNSWLPLAFDEATDVLVTISTFSADDRSPDYFYELAAQKIAATDVGALPAEHTGVVDNLVTRTFLFPVGADADGDALKDAGETALYGTDPSLADTDSDGIVDGAELEYGTDPLDGADSPVNADADDDGLGVAREDDYGTDPAVADTDGDGLGDGTEVVLRLDPLVADTDGDGTADGTELGAGDDPRSTTSQVGFGDWYRFDATAGEVYAVELDSASTDFRSRIRAYDGATMEEIKGTSGSRLRWQAQSDGPVFIEISDSDDRGDADFTYTMRVSTVAATVVSPGTSQQLQLADAGDETIVTFSAPAGAVGADVTTDGGWLPRVRLLRGGSLDPVSGTQNYRGMVYNASSDAEDYAVAVSAEDASLAGPLDFTITISTVEASTAAAETEPNDDLAGAEALAGLPAAVAGSLGNGDMADVFSVELAAGQRVWIIGTHRGSGSVYALNPEIDLIAPDGSVADNDRYGGEYLFPAIHAFEIRESGTWKVRFKHSSSSDAGDYALYVLTSPVGDLAEAEPNDDVAAAQDIGALDWPTRITATVDATDPTDVYRFSVPFELGSLTIKLEGAQPGHEIRFLDVTGAEIAASGPSHDGLDEPVIGTGTVVAGDYLVEVTQGTGGGSFELVLLPNP